MASLSSSLVVLFLVALFLTPQALAEVNPSVEKAAADEYDPNGYKPPYKKPYKKPYYKPPYKKHPPMEDNKPYKKPYYKPPYKKHPPMEDNNHV